MIFSLMWSNYLVKVIYEHEFIVRSHFFLDLVREKIRNTVLDHSRIWGWGEMNSKRIHSELFEIFEMNVSNFKIFGTRPKFFWNVTTKPSTVVLLQYCYGKKWCLRPPAGFVLGFLEAYKCRLYCMPPSVLAI